MKLNLLAFGAHPDDVELSSAGTILNQIALGRTAGIIDLTQGELGTRGNVAVRKSEAASAAHILGLSVRENLQMADGFFMNDAAHQLKVIGILRKYQPDIVLCNAIEDRHPDHSRAAELVETSCFLSGLTKIETWAEDVLQHPWRPNVILHYIQDRYIHPDVVIDISDFWEKKMESIKAHSSQFYDPNSNEPETYIASKGFFEMIETRAREIGRANGFKYAEGFTCKKIVGIKDLGHIY